MSKKENIIDASYDATQDESFENRSVGNPVRGEDNRITHYHFRIFIQDKPTLEGDLSREQMELMFRNYSSEGANLTQKTVSRDFPYTLSDFKKILRAFKVTKASIPFPQHILEERTSDELTELVIQQKEVDFLKKYEQDKGNLFKKKFNELVIQHQQLKDAYRKAEYISREVDPVDFVVKRNPNGTKSLMVYLSDMHIGAYVSNEGVYDNEYNEAEVNRRLGKVLEKISSYKDIDNLIIFNLGDAIDGYNASTTRPGSTHKLPQNMSNKEQGQVLLRQMSGFFNYIQKNIPHNKLYFYSVGHSNHGGDFEHSIITALSIMLESMGVVSYVSTRPIDHLTLDDKTIIFMHGKDNLDQFKNFPLVINDKTELYLNEYIYQHNLRGDILVVKGDLHQSATSHAKLFKYKSVGSLFGSSNWIHANFGSTKWCCDYTVIDEQGDMIDGVIKDR